MFQHNGRQRKAAPPPYETSSCLNMYTCFYCFDHNVQFLFQDCSFTYAFFLEGNLAYTVL